MICSVSSPFTGRHIQCRSRQTSELQRFQKSHLVNQFAARCIYKKAADFHFLEAASVKEASVLLSKISVESDDIRPLQELCQAHESHSGLGFHWTTVGRQNRGA